MKTPVLKQAMRPVIAEAIPIIRLALSAFAIACGSILGVSAGCEMTRCPKLDIRPPIMGTMPIPWADKEDRP